MSAADLGQAAALMRELADKAAKQPVVKVNVEGVWLGSRFYMVTTPDREYALADWLEEVADIRRVITGLAKHTGSDPDAGSDCFLNMESKALAVATAYLGSP